MAENIEFEISHNYNLFESGITVKTVLTANSASVYFDAKIDTGSTYCIFERIYGEGLGLDIETGLPVEISTATGNFRAYGHNVEIEVLGLKFESIVYFAESEYFERNVLGRNGWLRNVKLGLIDEEGKLFLSKYDSE
jgi:hypothetical protein